MRRRNEFGHVCLSVCVCPVPAVTCESLDLETSFFGMKAYLQNIRISVMVEYQGHVVKVKVI